MCIGYAGFVQSKTEPDILVLVTTVAGKTYWGKVLNNDDPLKEVAYVREHGLYVGKGGVTRIECNEVQQIDIVRPGDPRYPKDEKDER